MRIEESTVEIQRQITQQTKPGCWGRARAFCGVFDPRDWSSITKLKIVAATNVVFDVLCLAFAADALRKVDEMQERVEKVQCTPNESLCGEDVRAWEQNVPTFRGFWIAGIVCSALSTGLDAWSLGRLQCSRDRGLKGYIWRGAASLVSSVAGVSLFTAARDVSWQVHEWSKVGRAVAGSVNEVSAKILAAWTLALIKIIVSEWTLIPAICLRSRDPLTNSQ